MSDCKLVRNYTSVLGRMEFYLHASVIYIECEIPIPDLERGGFIVDQVRAYNIEL